MLCFSQVCYCWASGLGHAEPGQARTGQPGFRTRLPLSGCWALGPGLVRPVQVTPYFRAGLLLHGLVRLVLLGGAGLVDLRVRPAPVTGYWILEPGL